MADYKNPFANKNAESESKEENDGKDIVFDWGDTIPWEDSPDYITLAPGNYEFTVQNFEKGYYNGNAEKHKEACPTAKVTVYVDTDKGRAYAKYTFFLKKSAAVFIRDFFICIGLAKKGDAIKANFDDAVGCTGMAEFTTHEYNGNTYNDVRKWIKP